MLEKVQQDRLNKLQRIRDLGVDPYGSKYETAQPIAKILDGYQDETEGQTADAAGRLILFRDMGKMIFAHIRDQSGQMQVAFRKNAMSETEFQLAKLLDLGDVIACSGPLQKSRTGEITIWAEKLTFLTKSLLPMPEKFHGLRDIELRSRQRYLDLMTNPESMQRFSKRLAIIEHFRRTLMDRGFSEVETPMLQPIYGGAAARPFTTHHNALDMLLYMRISPETYLKRLLVGGMEKVFEINRNFRNEGVDASHNPEFTMMELYQAYADYTDMMEITETLVSTAAEAVCGSTKVQWGELELDFATPWRRAEYGDLLKEHAGVDMFDIPAVREKARRLGIEEKGKDDAVVVNLVFEETVEQHLVQPMFVLNYPAAICPLTRRHPDDDRIALRFEAFAANMELANAYTELNDPEIQLENFSAQVAGEDDETMRVMDEDFILALQHGMPPAGGLGVGVDRIVMLLTDTQNIRDVILFPLMRPLGGRDSDQAAGDEDDQALAGEEAN
ncbi:MAG: lysine--tRNA ligase [Phycisphaerae bacterium]